MVPLLFILIFVFGTFHKNVPTTFIVSVRVKTLRSLLKNQVTTEDFPVWLSCMGLGLGRGVRVIVRVVWGLTQISLMVMVGPWKETGKSN